MHIGTHTRKVRDSLLSCSLRLLLSQRSSTDRTGHQQRRTRTNSQLASRFRVRAAAYMRSSSSLTHALHIASSPRTLGWRQSRGTRQRTQKKGTRHGRSTDVTPGQARCQLLPTETEAWLAFSFPSIQHPAFSTQHSAFGSGQWSSTSSAREAAAGPGIASCCDYSSQLNQRRSYLRLGAHPSPWALVLACLPFVPSLPHAHRIGPSMGSQQRDRCKADQPTSPLHTAASRRAAEMRPDQVKVLVASSACDHAPPSSCSQPAPSPFPPQLDDELILGLSLFCSLRIKHLILLASQKQPCHTYTHPHPPQQMSRSGGQYYSLPPGRPLPPPAHCAISLLGNLQLATGGCSPQPAWSSFLVENPFPPRDSPVATHAHALAQPAGITDTCSVLFFPFCIFFVADRCTRRKKRYEANHTDTQTHIYIA